MIISQLAGGLGNQLFQYAFGFSRAQSNGVSFKLDLSFFEDCDLREYCLFRFNVSAEFASKSEIEVIKSKDLKIWHKLQRKLWKKENHLVIEENLKFDFNFLDIAENSYVIGYWQSAKYFENYWNLLSVEFEFLNAPSKNNLEIIETIDNVPISVSLHVRRGDYVSTPADRNIHGTLPICYYEKAIEYLGDLYNQPSFFVFSDDINWARKNILIPHRTIYVDINDNKSAYEDLRLMSLCSHNIIANSTFSWWGGYLNKNPGKIVVAPKQWFADEVLNQQTIDLIPESWIRI